MGNRTFDQDLARRLAELRQQGLHRLLRRIDSPPGTRICFDGHQLLNFSSNDYLGLASHPALREAAARAAQDFGAGSGASRLICGSLGVFHELEEELARFKGTEAALTFSTGYAAALGAITSLVGPQDVVALDKLSHACLVDAARLSGAQLRVFKHNDLASLEHILQWSDRHRPTTGERRVLIVTESVFSMDGDQAPLRELVGLKEKYGAWLMVDEAHSTGLYGKSGAGLIAEANLTGEVEVQMGTLGKALGASGGFLCGSGLFRDFLVNRARSFIFSTAPVPAAAAAALAGLRLAGSSEGEMRREQLWRNVNQLRSEAALTGSPPSAITPVLIGEETKALEAFQDLVAKGFFVPAVRYPTVARGRARLRVTLSAAHETPEITALAQALQSHRPSP